MTFPNTSRIQARIKKLKAALAADRRRGSGYYDDSRGLRYLLPALYIQAGDYDGGHRYLNWFNKTFPDDIGTPDLHFEAAIILFYRGKWKDAQRAVFRTYFANTYLFDRFYGQPLVPIDKYEYSNWQTTEYAEAFEYRSDQVELGAFADWLSMFLEYEGFEGVKQDYLRITKQLKAGAKGAEWTALLGELREVERAGKWK